MEVYFEDKLYCRTFWFENEMALPHKRLLSQAKKTKTVYMCVHVCVKERERERESVQGRTGLIFTLGSFWN